MTTEESHEQPIADALYAAFTAEGWDVVAAFHGGYDVTIAPGLVASTGACGWDYASVSDAGGPVEDVEGPEWPAPGDDLAAFALNAVDAMLAYLARYRAARAERIIAAAAVRTCPSCELMPAAPGDRYCDGCGSASDRSAWAHR